ncbi:hypothetical protein KJ980_04750 [Patescibacteria group bacterium]|nr:hypothetical protein [Patescibacteria group bacterium]
MKSYKSNKRRHEDTCEIGESGFSDKVVEGLRKQVNLTNDDFLDQLPGLNDSEKQVNESVVFELFKQDKSTKNSSEKKSSKKKRNAEIQPGMDYHREYYESIARFGERGSYSEVMQEGRQIQQIMAEIRKLASSTKLLQVEFGLVAVQDVPTNPGKYYVNFFEWMLVMLKQARQKVEDSKSWLQTVKGKSKKKAGYWDKTREHGTSFSQANERFVATSTG